MNKKINSRNIVFFLFIALSVSKVSATENNFPVTNISTAQQNEMIEKYCVICHMDRAYNGGLSLEHFDAVRVSPALAAILVNKFTTGVPLAEVMNAEKTPEVINAIEAGKKQGAPSVMGIAGLPLPTEGEVNGFILAMASRSEGAEKWHVVNDGEAINADISRVTSLPERWRGREIIYRLNLRCNLASGEGAAILSWSPIPVNGTLEVIVDDGAKLDFVLDQQESMANGSPGISSPSSIVIAGIGKNEKHPSFAMPKNNLRIKGPLRTEQVEFPFHTLGESVRKQMGTCFEK